LDLMTHDLASTVDRPVEIIGPPRLSVASAIRALARLGAHRDLFLTLSAHRVRVRYKQSVLGVAWAVVQPLSMMLIFTAVFSVIGRMPSRGTPYAVFSYSGLVPWVFLSTTLTATTHSLLGHAQLVTRVYFPREILPLTYVIAGLFDFVLASAVLGVLLAIYQVPITLHVLYAVPVIAVLAIFVTALGLLFSAVQVRFRDVGVALPLLLQLWLFASPVLYPLDSVPPSVRALYVLNPMAGLIDAFRRAVLHGAAPDTRALAVSVAVAFVALPAAYLYFKRVEATMADVI
jgi:lipopolysaccharide transport system permease protein